jgi:hypothetical protein
LPEKNAAGGTASGYFGLTVMAPISTTRPSGAKAAGAGGRVLMDDKAQSEKFEKAARE